MGKLVKGIHHVSMKCCSEEALDKAKDFYGNVLGLEIAHIWDGGVMFQTGNSVIEIFSNGTDDKPEGTIRHFAFDIESTDACIEAVRAAGYEVYVEPKDIVIPSDPEYPARVAFCYGPLGEEIEFFQEK